MHACERVPHFLVSLLHVCVRLHSPRTAGTSVARAGGIFSHPQYNTNARTRWRRVRYRVRLYVRAFLFLFGIGSAGHERESCDSRGVVDLDSLVGALLLVHGELYPLSILSSRVKADLGRGRSICSR